MDQEKIGAFIAQCRKEAGYTQAALGEKLGITDRAVSKWETGKSMPDPSLMLELCGLLHINVNELLTGARMDMEQYQEQAEKHLLELQRQEAEQNKKLLSLETVIAASATVNYLEANLRDTIPCHIKIDVPDKGDYRFHCTPQAAA